MQRLAVIATEEKFQIFSMDLLNYQLLGNMKPDGVHFDPGLSYSRQDAWVLKCVIQFYVNLRNAYNYSPYSVGQDFLVTMHNMPWMGIAPGVIKRHSSRSHHIEPDRMEENIRIANMPSARVVRETHGDSPRASHHI